MNYCILNGKKSTMVKGLLIQSLPPITKPLMRTRIEEVDGRDGDIITKLGYSAYNREMSIGLFGDYDLSEVAQYFDSEGEVIFSNELDKKYRYKILDEINFERLGIFKQAIVTFHVQPFKYSSSDDRTNILYANYYEKQIINYGNVIARPRWLIPASSSVNTTVSFSRVGSGLGTLNVNVNKNKDIIIDVETKQAYEVASGTLVNRNISGDTDVLALEAGINKMNVDIHSVAISSNFILYDLSRWI